MRVLAVSIAPLFSDRVQGGSQRILMEAVDALAEAGHEVRVLAPGVAGEHAFQTEHGANIEPTLGLRSSFPAPYQTAPHRLTSTWNELRDGAGWADRAYLHADAVYMRAALDGLPIVRSLHDFVYEESLLSAFTLPAHRTIVPSRYMRDCIEASAGAVTDIGGVTVVPNGVAAHDSPVAPRLPEGIAARRENDLILLHPHRLHREKGVEESIKIAVEVQAQLPGRQVRLLVPAIESEQMADDAALTVSTVKDFARSAGGDKLLEFHHWLSPEMMPGYFAAGDVTLCPGSFVEAFGLVPLESVAAGTPAVCARVGALREQAGLAGITQFDYGDIFAAAEAVVSAVSVVADGEIAASEITERYSLTEMRNAYVDTITGPLPGTSVASEDRSKSQQVAWKLAPWCYVSGERIYHDYHARFENFPVLTERLARASNGLLQEPLSTESELAELSRASKEGFVLRSRSA